MDSYKLVSFWVDFTYDAMPSIPMMMGEAHPSTNFGWKKNWTLYFKQPCPILCKGEIFIFSLGNFISERLEILYKDQKIEQKR